MSLLDTASLIVTPNAYKEGKLYSVIPSDGAGDMNVVRATTATRVNADGLVELVPYNLLTQSQNFTSGWSGAGITATANFGVAPDGTTTSTRLVFSGASQIWQKAVTGLINLNGTFSVFIKGIAGQTIQITYGGNDNVVTLQSGWNRFSVTGVGLINSVFINTFAGVTARDIEVWGGQVVEGSTAKPYQKTETRLNIPRLDYSNGTCPSLLVEPQRTNLLTFSEDFANSSWTKAFGSLSSNIITSPSGTITADKFIENTQNIGHYLERLFTSIASTTYSFSVYAKAAERTRIAINILSITPPFENIYVEADLIAGTLVIQQAANGATFAGATIEELPNGWYRITASGSIATKTNMRVRIFLVNNSGQIEYLGNGTSGLFVWGAQLEVGSYPTSFIPTTTASVTRNADVISKTGISSLIGQTEGVIYLENSFLSNDLTAKYFTLSDGTNTKRIIFNAETTSNQIRMVVVNSTVQAEIFYTLSDITEFNKIAIKYKENDFAFWVNGVLIGTDTSGTVPSGLNTIKFSNADNSIPFFGKVKTLALWPTALTNTQLAELTTL